MKSYTTTLLASTGSPLYSVNVIEDDDSTIIFDIAINENDNLANAVLETYQSIKNPAAPKPPTYAQKRQAEYPPVTDYLDGIVKGDQMQIQKYIDDCQAIKAKYPKD